jgi:hypothetical protein
MALQVRTGEFDILIPYAMKVVAHEIEIVKILLHSLDIKSA